MRSIDQAVPHYRSAIELTSQQHVDMLLKNITDTLARYADGESAMSAMQEIVDTFPEVAAVQLAYARLAAALGNTEISASATDRALNLNPDWEDAAVFKFKLLLSLDKADEAIDFSSIELQLAGAHGVGIVVG